MTRFISNSEFNYLSPADRDKLKKDYHNYIYRSGTFYHYIQDTNPYWFNIHLEEITKMHLENINIYINDAINKQLNLVKQDTDIELF